MSGSIQQFVTLESFLRQLPEDLVCLYSVAKTYTVADIISDALKLRNVVKEAKGNSVALDGLNPLELITAIIALDGFAASILFVPKGTANDSLLDELLFSIGTSVVIQEGLKANNLKHPYYASPTLTKPTKWLLSTSGTTGKPKIIEHQVSTLSRSIVKKNVYAQSYIWGLVYDSNRFAGLQVVLQALISGSILVIPKDMSFETQVDAMVNFSVNALSATPTLWRKLLMDGRILGLQLKQLSLGGEIVDQSLLNTLRSKFPNSRIVHIYASTEAGTGFSVKDGLEGFPSAWLNNEGISPRLKIGTNGHLLIKPSILPEGKEVSERLDEEGYLDTQDRVHLIGDRVMFLGRSSGAINIGGNKLNPEWLEHFLLGIEGVAEAQVSGKPSKITGQLIVVSIVAEPNIDKSLLKQTIIEICHNKLEKWQTPALIKFVEQLEMTSTGKLNRANS
jgi:acyl-coenzyme A synthetase/AMP-(fatty) acid ligase